MDVCLLSLSAASFLFSVPASVCVCFRRSALVGPTSQQHLHPAVLSPHPAWRMHSFICCSIPSGPSADATPTASPAAASMLVLEPSLEVEEGPILPLSEMGIRNIGEGDRSASAAPEVGCPMKRGPPFMRPMVPAAGRACLRTHGRTLACLLPAQ